MTKSLRAAEVNEEWHMHYRTKLFFHSLRRHFGTRCGGCARRIGRRSGSASRAPSRPGTCSSPDGKLAGYDIDLTAELCKRAKVECELIVQDWASLIPGLNAGKFDLVLTLGINEKRKQWSISRFPMPVASPPSWSARMARGTMPMTGERLNLNDKAEGRSGHGRDRRSS